MSEQDFAQVKNDMQHEKAAPADDKNNTEESSNQPPRVEIKAESIPVAVKTSLGEFDKFSESDNNSDDEEKNKEDIKS